MPFYEDIWHDPTPEVAKQLLKVAKKVALKYAQNYPWSTWHSWNASRFGTGVFEDHMGVVSLIYAELCAELSLLAGEQGCDYDSFLAGERGCDFGCDYAKYATLLCSAGEERHHAIVALCFESFAIVIDHAMHPTAFRVPLGSVYEMHPYTTISGREGQERFKYFLEDGDHKLTMDSKHASYDPFVFYDLINSTKNGYMDCAQQAAIVRKKYADEMKNGVLPTSKHLAFRSLLDKEPQFIAAVPVGDKWLATTVRIRVDFAEPRIVMQIPRVDWPQSENLSLLLLHPTPKGFRLYKTYNTVLLEQKLYAARGAEPKQELVGLAQLKTLGKEFGVSCELFDDICRSVYRVWDPVGLKSSKLLGDDETHGALGYL
jgi:hypothetical protein